MLALDLIRYGITSLPFDLFSTLSKILDVDCPDVLITGLEPKSSVTNFCPTLFLILPPVPPRLSTTPPHTVKDRVVKLLLEKEQIAT